MAKLTLSFKGRFLSISHLDEHPTIIGRDPDCGISIDSLAIAPRQLELVPSSEGYLLLALDPDFPVTLNNVKVDQAGLRHGDIIQIGKHTLTFAEDSQDLAPRPVQPAPEQDTAQTDEQRTEEDRIPACVQVQSGPRIGRVIILRRSVTRLKRAGMGDLVITRDGDLFRLSRLGQEGDVMVNGSYMEGGDLELANDSTIEMGDLRVCFFCGKDAVPEGMLSE